MKDKDCIDNIKIEKGIPLAPSQGKPGFVSVLKKMNVGDSIVIPSPSANSIRATARYVNVKIAVRSLGDGKISVWRIE